MQPDWLIDAEADFEDPAELADLIAEPAAPLRSRPSGAELRALAEAEYLGIDPEDY